MSSTYDDYHKNCVRTSTQKKKIDKRNFTYFNFFRFIFPIIQNIKPKKILDVGSGAGTISLFLGGQGYHVTGVDISRLAIRKSDESVKNLKLQRFVNFVNCDINEFSPRKLFDLILCFEVIEHIGDDAKFLNKLQKLLSKNGLLILSTPLGNAPLARLGLVKKFDALVGHVRRYSKNDFISVLEKRGFSVCGVIETEGIIRNSLFVLSPLGFFIKFIKGHVSSIVTMIDDFSGKIFGYSDLIVLAKRK